MNNKELFIIDAGDGKGYLSSRLAIEYKLKVLGVDANNLNSMGAVKRNVKLMVCIKFIIMIKISLYSYNNIQILLKYIYFSII